MDISTDQLKAIAERAIKTFAQAFGAYILAGEATSLYEVDWVAGAGVAGLAAVLSLITSIASWNFGPSEGPSLAGEVPFDEHLKYKNEVLEADMVAEMDRLKAEEIGD